MTKDFQSTMDDWNTAEAAYLKDHFVWLLFTRKEMGSVNALTHLQDVCLQSAAWAIALCKHLFTASELRRQRKICDKEPKAPSTN